MAVKIQLLAVGKLKEKYWTDACKEYAKRLSRFCTLEITELPEERTADAEGQNILKKLKSGCCSVLFDLQGEAVSSEDIAELFSKKLIGGTSEFVFIIGGSEGVSDAVKNAVSKRISLGKVTYPHQLMRVIALEQIYRAMTINNNITYHK